MAQTTRTDHIATLAAVVSERRKDLTKSERRLANAQRRGRFVAISEAVVKLDRAILAGVERDLAAAQADEA
jgi:hypothetical protein